MKIMVLFLNILFLLLGCSKKSSVEKQIIKPVWKNIKYTISSANHKIAIEGKELIERQGSSHNPLKQPGINKYVFKGKLIINSQVLKEIKYQGYKPDSLLEYRGKLLLILKNYFYNNWEAYSYQGNSFHRADFTEIDIHYLLSADSLIDENKRLFLWDYRLLSLLRENKIDQLKSEFKKFNSVMPSWIIKYSKSRSEIISTIFKNPQRKEIFLLMQNDYLHVNLDSDFNDNLRFYLLYMAYLFPDKFDEIYTSINTKISRRHWLKEYIEQYYKNKNNQEWRRLIKN